MSAKLDIDSLKVASPCSARWEDMTGDERVRFCAHCQKHVYNFAQLTRAETEDLIREKEGRLCVRMYRRKDGTVLTADCPVGGVIRRHKQQGWLAGAFAAVALLFGAWVVKARDGDAKVTKSDNRVSAVMKEELYRLKIKLGIVKPAPLMGDICIVVPQQPAVTNAPSQQKPAGTVTP